jgi:hypothetical protein
VATIADGSGKTKTNFAFGSLKNKFAPDDLARIWIAVGLVCPNADRDHWVPPLLDVLPKCRQAVLEEAWRILIAKGERLAASGLDPGIEMARRCELIRTLSLDSDIAIRAETIAWIADGGWVHCPDVLVRGLSDPDPQVATAADSALRRLVDGAGKDLRLVELVRGVLRHAASEFALHQSRAVASGVVATTGPGSDRTAWDLIAADDASRAFLARALRSGGHDSIRLRAWEHLAVPSFTAAAVDRLRAACGPMFHAMVLERAHLVRSDPRQQAVARLSPRDRAALIAGMVPMSFGVLSRLGHEACIGVSQLMTGLGVDVAARERWGRVALAHPSPLVRFAAWRTTPSRTAMDYAFDRDSSVARSAATAGSGAAGPWRALQRSPHAEVRLIAAGEIARFGLEWTESSAAVIGLRRRCQADPAGLEREWRDRWQQADTAERIVLMRLALRVGLGKRVTGLVQQQIIADAPAGTPQARVAATAVRLFGNGAADAVAACLAAPDARLRANAVEACSDKIARTGTMLELKGDPNHRVRANAVRRLAWNGSISSSDALREVNQMSGHADASHRLAGAWMLPRVAEVVGRRVVAKLVEHRLQTEDDHRVRARLEDAAARFREDLGVLAMEAA